MFIYSQTNDGPGCAIQKYPRTYILSQLRTQIKKKQRELSADKSKKRQRERKRIKKIRYLNLSIEYVTIHV